MFGRSVMVDGREVWVWCVPSTPYSEVLERAAAILKREEDDAAKNSPSVIAYRDTVRRAWSA